MFAPPDCALTYRYYSLHVEGGDAGVLAAADATAKRFADATTGLPAAMQGSDNGYFVIPTFTAATRVAVKRSLDPAVTALNLFGIAAAASTLLVALLIAVRLARRDEDDAQVWFLLGATRAQRRAAIAFRLVVACAGGLVGALLVGWVGSAIGPVASARSVEPAGRMGLSGDIGLVVLGAAAVFMVGASTIAAIGPTKARHRTLRTSVSSTGWSLPNLGSPWLTAGARAAFAGSGARALLAASVAAVVAVVATVVFTTSLNTFVAKPDRFGWPYDVAAMVGFGYGGSDEAAIAATLDRPEVKAWGMAIVDSGSAINGEPTPIVAERDGFGELALPVIDGTAPIGDDELGLGALTADRLGLAPGDKALLVTTFGEREVTVSGLVVLPTIGQYEADRASLGNGALLSERLTDRILADAAEQPELATLTDGAASFVAVDLHDGVDSRAFLTDISDGLLTWDTNGFAPFLYSDPVRPAPVADVAAIRAVPSALVGLLAVAMAGALGLGVTAAARARRRELAVMWALGCVTRQLRASVRWHALLVVGLGLAVGVPLGVALGGTSYRAFAAGLGFSPDPEVTVGWILLIVITSIVTGLLASAGATLVAGRSPAKVLLRNDC